MDVTSVTIARWPLVLPDYDSVHLLETSCAGGRRVGFRMSEIRYAHRNPKIKEGRALASGFYVSDSDRP